MLPGGRVRKPEKAANGEWGEKRGCNYSQLLIHFKLPFLFLKVSLSNTYY